MATLTINETGTAITYQSDAENYVFQKSTVGYFNRENDNLVRVATIGGEVLLMFTDEEERDSVFTILEGLF